MMGVWPESNVNDLTEWQQQNAVPPLDGVDFTQWQQELGAYALPYGLNIFPIQQLGRAADYVLSLDNVNCQRFAY
jgi:hypothetical protein